MIIDGIHVTDAERLRAIRVMEDDANVEADCELVQAHLQRTPPDATTESGGEEQADVSFLLKRQAG